MLNKAKKILRNESGLSMIIVLSISALFVALSAAVLYAASSQMASANRVLPAEDAYRMAYSFMENVLEPDLKARQDEPNALQHFLTDTFMDPSKGYAIGENYYFSENAGTDADENIRITLKKIGPESSDLATQNTTLLFDADTTETLVNKFDNSDYTKYTVAVTVEVKVGGEDYALTKRYTCKPRYAIVGTNDVYKYDYGTQFVLVDIKEITAELQELKDGRAIGYYIWLPEGGEG